MHAVATPQSPLQVELKFFLQLPPARAFELVTERLPEWFSLIHSVSWDHSRSSGSLGACSERTCDFGGKALREVITSFEPGRRYSYSADLERSELKMPLQDHVGTFEVQEAQGGSAIIWRQHFRPKWFMPACLLRWQMGRRLMRPAVERLFEKFGGTWAG